MDEKNEVGESVSADVQSEERMTEDVLLQRRDGC